MKTHNEQHTRVYHHGRVQHILRQELNDIQHWHEGRLMEYKKSNAWDYQDDDDHTAIAPHCRQFALKRELFSSDD